MAGPRLPVQVAPRVRTAEGGFGPAQLCGAWVPLDLVRRICIFLGNLYSFELQEITLSHRKISRHANKLIQISLDSLSVDLSHDIGSSKITEHRKYGKLIMIYRLVPLKVVDLEL